MHSEDDTFNTLKYRRIAGSAPNHVSLATGTIYWVNDSDELHRSGGPAIEYTNGSIQWYRNGKLHREDGPAIEYSTGTKYWYINGVRHRADGPAVEWANGTKYWYINGVRHREDGPAVEWANGTTQWWINGEFLTKDAVSARVKLSAECPNESLQHRESV